MITPTSQARKNPRRGGRESMEPPPPATPMSDLIPGLPEDMARECLLRLSFQHLPTARRVSRGWKAELESPAHHRSRRRHAILALAQAEPPLADSGPARKYAASGAGHSFRLVLHDPYSATAGGSWAPLPTPPACDGRLPLFCRLVAAGQGPAAKLLVMGGWDPETWAPTASVHVYDFLSGTWRRGKDMPPPRRSFFACAAVGNNVFVAGGHDEEKNALQSAAAYDVEADVWTAVPDMATERDEPGGVCVGGRFVVVGGYPTDAQGRFVGSAEAFDPGTWSWGGVEERVIEDGACPRTCCAAPPGAGSRMMYMLRDGCVMARDAEGGDRWRTLARLPEDGQAATTVASIGDGRVVVLGAEQQRVYVLSHDQATPASWTRVVAPPEFAGHVQVACCVQI